MNGGIPLSIWIALGAGVLSFISPCTLPLFPSYLGYISGVSFSSLSRGEVGRSTRVNALVHAVLFCIGLSFLFILLGFGATTFGQILSEHKRMLRFIGGILILLMGGFMTGMFRLDVLLKERRYSLPSVKPLGYLGSLLVGIAFAAGWTPCIGPIFSSVIILTVNNPDVGVWYMVAYAIGFSVPFLLLALTLTSVRPVLKYTETVAKIGGWLMILMGVLLITNKMTWITILIQKYTHYRGV